MICSPVWIREQQQVISKLETEKHQLQLKNETLLLSNSKLQTKLQWSETLQSVERQQVPQSLHH